MLFSVPFWIALRTRPLAALGALYWHISGRKLRARNRLRMSVAQSPSAYPMWIQSEERRDLLLVEASGHILSWKYHPLFSVIFHAPDDWTPDAQRDLHAMMHAQVYPAWELIIVPSNPNLTKFNSSDSIRFADSTSDNAMEALRVGLEMARGQYVLPLPPSTRLPPTCLFRFAEYLQPQPNPKLLFGDNDWIDKHGRRHTPWFKPQWNTELALSQDYISQSLVISTAVARRFLARCPQRCEIPGYALALAVGSETPDAVVHIPHVQSHVLPDPRSEDQNATLSIVRFHLDMLPEKGAVASPGSHGTIRVDWPLPAPQPLVSIIIPTRDKRHLLEACISSLTEHTNYEPYEIVVVDNGSEEAESLRYLQALQEKPFVKIVRDDRPYNFSQLNNVAVSVANGEYLCLLNNDTEVIDGDWLKAMMRQAVRPHVGAVGAKLLYDDGSIQHAGVTIGLGQAAGHAHRFLADGDPGYFARAHASHYVSAVTAACLVVSKGKYQLVGGLDENSFAVAFNDVDLCLKLGRNGFKNVYAPQARLLHHESKSRGKDTSSKHIKRYTTELNALQSKWKTIDFKDPLHNINLDRSNETYLIKL